MKPHEPYKPKLQKNILADAAAAVFTAAVALMWVFRDRISAETSDLCVLSVFALLLIAMSAADRKRKKEIYQRAEDLRIQREEMEKDNFSDSSIFFR